MDATLSAPQNVELFLVAEYYAHQCLKNIIYVSCTCRQNSFRGFILFTSHCVTFSSAFGLFIGIVFGICLFLNL